MMEMPKRRLPPFLKTVDICANNWRLPRRLQAVVLRADGVLNTNGELCQASNTEGTPIPIEKIRYRD